LLALTWAPLSAVAGLPLVTETADALGRGDCELEAQVARATTQGLPAVREWGVLGACGVGLDTQLALGLTRASMSGFDHTQAVGLSGKTNFKAPEAGQTGWGLGYALDAHRDPGESWHLHGHALTLLATRELAPGWLGHANLGWAHSRRDKLNSTVWSLGIERTGTLTWAADVFGDDRNKPGASTGLGYDFGGGFSANLSVATLFETPRIRVVTLGAKFAF
jgi:hypothetical protein